MTIAIDEALRIHLASRSPYLFVVSWEEDRVLKHLERLRPEHYGSLFTWSITRGLVTGDESLGEQYTGPYAALEYIEAHRESALFVLQDFHPYLSDSRLIRKLRDLIPALQTSASAIIFVAPKLVVPLELEKDMIVMDYPLPTLEDARQLFGAIERGVARNPRLTIDLDDEARDALMHATLGLTENETKNVLAKALISDASLTAADLDVILAEKEQIIRKSGLLECYSSPENFGDIGGLDQLKEWLESRRAAFAPRAREFYLPYPKGLLAIGVPGCGKSLIAKAVATRWRQPLLRMDVGRLFGSLVGSSEENIRRTIQVAEAVAPAILWIDEIEKGFAGIKSAGDSGTSARVFSTFLTWMQEKTSPLFVIATANDISSLPPELLRKGRFDEIFFVDLPLEEERRAILDIHLKKRGRDPARLTIDLDDLARTASGFSGAELEQIIVSALFTAYSAGTDLTTDILRRAIQETYPLAQTMREPIARMREWAEHRARYASAQRRDTEGKLHDARRWERLGAV